MVRRIALAAAPVIALAMAMLAHAGPVESYREGREFCPRDQPASAPALSEAQVDARAIALLPGFCTPSHFVTGCDAQPELVRGDWRVYIRQYQLRSGQHDFDGLDHSYVILDRVGNCLANIPGTPLGALH
ncbi:MAG: hypothetical protein ABI881_11370 [Betaproteobacteria bacterium]